MNFNDHQQLNRAAQASPASPPASYPKLAKKRRGGWLWSVLIILIIIAAAIFLTAVYSEISARDAQFKDLIKSAQKGTTGAILENQLLSGLNGAVISASSTADDSVSSTLAAVENSVPKDANRQLAEKLDRPHLGNASSSLVIVEFADFQCPICLQEFPIIRAVTNKYSSDIRFIFRNYPVIDQNSMMFAEAGMCAQEQGRFWPFHDRLYAAQGQIANLSDFQQIAVMSGLNWNKLQDCVNKEKYKDQILQDMSDALDLGVRGTPTFFVNGKKLEGAVDESVWDDIISKYKQLNNIK